MLNTHTHTHIIARKRMPYQPVITCASAAVTTNVITEATLPIIVPGLITTAEKREDLNSHEYNNAKLTICRLQRYSRDLRDGLKQLYAFKIPVNSYNSGRSKCETD